MRSTSRSTSASGVVAGRRAVHRALLPSETEYRRSIEDAATLLGWDVCWHRPGQNRDGTWVTATTLKGVPDLMLIRPPRLVFAEIKGPKTPITPEQVYVLERLGRCAGVEAYLWRSGKNDLTREIVPILQRSATI